MPKVTWLVNGKVSWIQTRVLLGLGLQDRPFSCSGRGGRNIESSRPAWAMQ